MSQTIDIKLPNIGDFSKVAVIELHVKVGDVVQAEQPFLTLESDKAAMEIPVPQSGSITRLSVKVGDLLSEGDVLGQLQLLETESKPVATVAVVPNNLMATEVLVLGAGPGGYTAAFRAADLGKKVLLVERYADLGGVCLNVGCIPSKALLHLAHIIEESQTLKSHGVQFVAPSTDLSQVVMWKNKVIQQLTGGLAGLAKKRGITVVQGVGQFSDSHHLSVTTPDGQQTVVQFEQAIIAVGSQATKIPNFPYDDPRVMDSTDALALNDLPKSLLIIGGGIIGLEMATVYAGLSGSANLPDCAISIAELGNDLIMGCDRDIVRPLQKRLSERYQNVWLNTQVTACKPTDAGLEVSFNGNNAPKTAVFDKVLVAVGRQPNGGKIGAQNAGVAVDARGFIAVDKQMRTNLPHIFAIGDVVGQPMLAHKAVHEAKVAAEVICGHKVQFDAAIPSVAYTDPEVAWMGMTEEQLKAQGIAYEKGSFPWAASGRSLSIGRNEGLTKLLFDKETKRLLGAGIVGTCAGELLAEVMVAYEMGADVDDLSWIMHAHPTLSETVAFAAEMAAGTITDLYAPRKTPW